MRTRPPPSKSPSWARISLTASESATRPGTARLPGRLCAISTSGAGGLEASDNWEMGNEHLAAAAYDIVAADYESRFVDELRTKPRDCELLDELAARATGPVLDIGSGPGHIGARVRSAGRHVVAVDLSGAMAAAARRRVDSAVVADMIHLPIATASVTDIVAFYSVIHLSRTQLHHALVEFSRVLVPEGTVLLSAHEGAGDVAVTEFLGHDVHLSATFFTLDELTGAVTDAHLELLSAERREPYENEGATNRLYIRAAKK